jgi:hypothetical protein
MLPIEMKRIGKTAVAGMVQVFGHSSKRIHEHPEGAVSDMIYLNYASPTTAAVSVSVTRPHDPRRAGWRPRQTSRAGYRPPIAASGPPDRSGHPTN